MDGSEGAPISPRGGREPIAQGPTRAHYGSIKYHYHLMTTKILSQGNTCLQRRQTEPKYSRFPFGATLPLQGALEHHPLL